MMNIKSQLKIENSRTNWLLVNEFIGDDAARFDELMQIFMGNDIKLVQRSSQPVGVLGAKYPHLLYPYLQELIAYLHTNPIDAVQRNLMRALQYMDIPEEFEGPIFDLALGYLQKIDSAIAVKAFSMTVLGNLCAKYPELTEEAIHQIELLIREDVSKGVSARARKELKRLRKIVANT